METATGTLPWTDFETHLRRAPRRLWILLGDCQVRCAQIARAPLAPEAAADVRRVCRADGIAATVGLGGDALAAHEVRHLLEGGPTLDRPAPAHVKEVRNLERLYDDIAAGTIAAGRNDLTPRMLRELNTRLLEDVEPGGTPEPDCPWAPAPEQRPAMLDTLCQWLTRVDAPHERDLPVVYGLIRAVTAHVFLSWLHPFARGNGRAARLAEFALAVNSGVPEPVAHLLSKHYFRTQHTYVAQLAESCHAAEPPVAFLLYAIEGLARLLECELDVPLWNEQWELAWRAFFRSRLGAPTRASTRRRLALLEELSTGSAPVPLAECASLSSATAAAYARCSRKTLSRDLAALCTMGLIEKTPSGYRAQHELMLGLMHAHTHDHA